MTYDPLKDLQPITLGTKVPNVLSVHPSVPAQARPGALTYGSSGIGNLQHLNGELLNSLAAPLIADLAGGQITMGFTSVAAAISLIKASKLRPIAGTRSTTGSACSSRAASRRRWCRWCTPRR